MPFIVPFIPLIVAGVGALTTGLQLAGVGQPSAHAGQAAAPDTTAQTLQDQKNRVASIAQRLPDIQSQLGGSVSPDFLMAMASQESGNPGDRTSAQIALNNWLGIDSGTSGPGSDLGSVNSSPDNPLSRGGGVLDRGGAPFDFMHLIPEQPMSADAIAGGFS